MKHTSQPLQFILAVILFITSTNVNQLFNEYHY